jgi:hypothetical protein
VPIPQKLGRLLGAYDPELDEEWKAEGSFGLDGFDFIMVDVIKGVTEGGFGGVRGAMDFRTCQRLAIKVVPTWGLKQQPYDMVRELSNPCIA